MRKRNYVILAILVLTLLITGCNNQSKTEEARKAEIKAAIESEESLKKKLKDELLEEMKASSTTTSQPNETSPVDAKTENSEDEVKDKDLPDIGTNKLKIMTRVLNVRSDKSSKSDVIGKVYLDENYEIVETAYTDDFRWTKIKLADGTFGWISGAFTKSLANAIPVSNSPGYPVPPSGQIEINIHMTIADIIKAVGDDYTINTNDDGGYYMYYTTLAYDDLSFAFYHDDPYHDKLTPDNILIESNKYTLKGIPFKLGDPVINAVAHCEENYNNFENQHGMGLGIAPDLWIYTDGERFIPLMVNGNLYDIETGTETDNSNYLYIKNIRLFTVLD